jgi:hypothetical protein
MVLGSKVSSVISFDFSGSSSFFAGGAGAFRFFFGSTGASSVTALFFPIVFFQAFYF